MSDPELARMRDEIASIDRELLAALNRRLGLVRRIAEHKEDTGAPAIDARREAELLAELAAANPGPLSEQGLRTAFSALLDVLKQEVRAGRPSADAAPPARRAAVSSLAVIGTGLVGTSVALAAVRSGVAAVTGWDTDARTLAASRVTPATSLADAVSGAELVVVAVPVGALPETVREVLAAAGAQTTVTDAGSTKRGVATIEDERFVPGHPLAGGSSGGPARATADLFDNATWLLTPTRASGADHVARLERFVESLGARPSQVDAESHDRLLAVTSHLPHVIANLLADAVAAAGDEVHPYVSPSLREMTRIAGANPGVWVDIFVENRDVLADALESHVEGAGEIVRALRELDRGSLQASIERAAAVRDDLLARSYRTDARQLHRIRVRVPDKPGVLARITQTLGAANINIEDFELRHVSPEYGGVLVLLIVGADNAELARTLLRREGYAAA